MDVRVKDIDLIGTVKVVMVKGEKGDVGVPTDSQVLTAVSEWLSAHPEATTTVQDGAITEAKLANDVKHMFGTKADAIIKTASGSIASFDDGGDDLPLKSLLVNIEPKQSGSGEPSPSNVRPISGYDSVNVYRTGINITDEEWEVGSISTTGYPFADPERMRTKNFNPCSPSTQYYVLFPMVGNDAQVFYYDINKNFISGTGWIYKGVVTTPPNAHYIKMLLGRTYGTTYNNDISINYPSTDTEYHAYQGTSYPISLGQIVYGGTCDVVSGKLTIDKVGLILDGTTVKATSISSYGTLKRYGIPYPTGLNARYTGASSFCLSDKITPSFENTIGATTDRPAGFYVFPHSSTLMVSMPSADYDSIALANGWFATNRPMVCYELATPTEITLTPTQVKTLLGNNNIFADSGSVEVEYRADTTLAYNKLLSAIASLS